MPAICLAIASDVRLYREGLEEVLATRQDVRVLAASGDVCELGRRLSEGVLEVLLLDASFLGAHALIEGASATGCRVVVVGLSEGTPEILDWARAGIAGFVTKGGGLQQLLQTIRAVARGEGQGLARVTPLLLDQIASLSRGSPLAGRSSVLTRREQEVLEYLAAGESNKRIARALGISGATAKNHVHNILAKLGVGSRGEAAAWVRGHRRGDRSPQRTG